MSRGKARSLTIDVVADISISGGFYIVDLHLDVVRVWWITQATL